MKKILSLEEGENYTVKITDKPFVTWQHWHRIPVLNPDALRFLVTTTTGRAIETSEILLPVSRKEEIKEIPK